MVNNATKLKALIAELEPLKSEDGTVSEIINGMTGIMFTLSEQEIKSVLNFAELVFCMGDIIEQEKDND